jgi:hypothetical protein
MIKNIFKKSLAYLSGFAISFLPLLTSAQNCSSEKKGYFTNPICASTLDGFLLQLLDVVILLGAIAVVFFLILAGFKYVTARGDEKQISSAHQTLTWTIIGGAIVLGARVIASAIQATVNELGI